MFDTFDVLSDEESLVICKLIQNVAKDVFGCKSGFFTRGRRNGPVSKRI